MLKPHSKAPRGLVALGSVAIIAVYGAGYARTRTAGSRFAETPALRRPAPPAAMVNTAAVHVSPPPLAPADPAPSKAASPTSAAAHRESHAPTNTPRVTRPESRTSAAPAEVSQPAGQPSAPPTASPASVAVTETALADAAAARAAADPTATRTPADAPAQPATKAGWKDGTYYGWGSSRHGDIQAAIVIVEGRIAGASIAQCLTRYSCSWIAHLPAQVIARQSADVDFVTGATQSVDAFYYAVLDALSKAK